MFLNRTKDPVLAAKAASEQKKLVELVSRMENEDLLELEKLTDLLRSGVDPSVPDYNLSLYYGGKNFYSPIHYAVKKGFFKVTDLLLNSRANPNALDRYSVTPAHLAAAIGSVKCLKKLIEFGADVNAKTQDFRKRAEVSGALGKLGILTPTEFSQIPVVREQQLDPEEFTFYILPFEVGSTPLHLAAKRDHVECVKLLIDQGADYNATDEKGQTSLYLAAKGLPNCVTAQLENAVGFPILSIPTTESDTALHECLRHGDKMRECIKELVHRGADVSLGNRWGETAIHLAVKYKWDMDMIRHLVLEGYGMDFDRQKQGATGCKRKWTDTPLLYVVGDRRVHNIGTGGTRAPPNRDENLATFFLQMGASRQCLKDLLWHELNREEQGGCLLNTLMNSFAYLPSFSELRHRTPEEENDAFSQDSSDEESVDMDVDEPQETADLRPANRDRDFNQAARRHYWPMFALHDVRSLSARRMRRIQVRAFHRRNLNVGNAPGNRDDDSRGPGEARDRVGRAAGPAPQQQVRPTSTSMIAEKHQKYAERCREIPTLAHLSRITIRNSLQADVRKVISFSIPTPVKEYILLGYQLSPRPAAAVAQDRDEKQQQSAPEESSSESVSRGVTIIELGDAGILRPSLQPFF